MTPSLLFPMTAGRMLTMISPWAPKTWLSPPLALPPQETRYLSSLPTRITLSDRTN